MINRDRTPEKNIMSRYLDNQSRNENAPRPIAERWLARLELLEGKGVHGAIS